jgi:hypothetical protein
MIKIANLKSRCQKMEQVFLNKILQYILTGCTSPPENFRTLVDSWYGYYMGDGFIKSTGTVQWFNRADLAKKRHLGAVQKMHFISSDAQKVLATGLAVPLVKDHSVPVKVLCSELSALKPKNVQDVKIFLLNRYRLGVITKCEDNRLCGPLKSGFGPGHSTTYGTFYRYLAARIF